MRICRGWYEDYVKLEPDEISELSHKMLKEKLSEVYDKIAINPDREDMAPKGRWWNG